METAEAHTHDSVMTKNRAQTMRKGSRIIGFGRLKMGFLILASFLGGCSDIDGTRLNFKDIKIIRLGDCEGRDLKAYSPGSAPFDSIISWLIMNSDGWYPSQESFDCKELIYFGNGTINVVDSLLVSNYRNKNGKSVQLVKIDSTKVIRKILSSI